MTLKVKTDKEKKHFIRGQRAFMLLCMYLSFYVGVKWSWLGRACVGVLPEGDTAGLRLATGSCPGVAGANKHSLYPLKTVFAK